MVRGCSWEKRVVEGGGSKFGVVCVCFSDTGKHKTRERERVKKRVKKRVRERNKKNKRGFVYVHTVAPMAMSDGQCENTAG